MLTLVNPIKVRDYDMYDKFILRSIIMYDEDAKILRMSACYGYVKSGHFVSSTFKEHGITINIEGADFDKINHNVRAKEQGSLLKILKERVYEHLKEKHTDFK